MASWINKPLGAALVTIAVAIGTPFVVHHSNNGNGGNGPQSCAPYPKFPDAVCTGIPDNVTPTAYSGSMTLSSDATIDSKTITGSLVVSGSANVTITRSQINGNLVNNGTGVITVQDSTLDCQRSTVPDYGTGLSGSGFNALRLDIQDCENGAYGGDLTIVDSYMHDFFQCSTAAACEGTDPLEPHTDGFQVDPAVNTTIKHNRIEGWTDPCRDTSVKLFDMSNGSCNGTSAVMLCNNTGCAPSHDVLVTQNLMSGGSSTLYCPKVSTTNVAITNNHFSIRYGGKVGSGGLASDCADTETWSGNVVHETGATITNPDAFGPYCDTTTQAVSNGRDPWGGCWPGAQTTGVPSGTTLTAYSGDLTVSTNNTVIDGYDVSGCVVVEASGVIVQNTQAYCVRDDGSPTAQNPANPPLIIRDSTLNCHRQAVPANWYQGITGDNIKAYRNDISGCDDGGGFDKYTTFANNYVHDLHQCDDYNCTEPSPHTDGVETWQGVDILYSHNTIYAYSSTCSNGTVFDPTKFNVFDVGGIQDGRCNGTSSWNVNGLGTNGTTTNFTAEKNLTAGGSDNIYCPTNATVNSYITNNQFSKIAGPKIGASAVTDGDCHNLTWTGNVVAETGATITVDQNPPY